MIDEIDEDIENELGGRLVMFKQSSSSQRDDEDENEEVLNPETSERKIGKIEGFSFI